MINISMNGINPVFVDTSALYALFNGNDRDHDSAKACMQDLIKNQSSLIISNFVLDEIYTLLLTRTNREIALTIIETLIDEWVIERISSEDEERAFRILKTSQDKSYSYTDATSFALIERLSIPFAFSFDKHFSQYGLIVTPD